MKGLILILLFFIFGNNCEGQLIGAGLNGGLARSSIKAPDASSGSNNGINGGLKFEFALKESSVGYPLRISPELFIRQAGTNDFINSFEQIELQNLDLTYLGLYLPITFTLGEYNDEGIGKFSGVMFQTGLFLDYAYSGESTSVNGYTDNPFKSGNDRIDFGFSANIQIHLGAMGGLQLGYNWGVNNISFTDNLSTEVFAKNRGLYINYVAQIYEE